MMAIFLYFVTKLCLMNGEKSIEKKRFLEKSSEKIKKHIWP